LWHVYLRESPDKVNFKLASNPSDDRAMRRPFGWLVYQIIVTVVPSYVIISGTRRPFRINKGQTLMRYFDLSMKAGWGCKETTRHCLRQDNLISLANSYYKERSESTPTNSSFLSLPVCTTLCSSTDLLPTSASPDLA
jgi:hypothetical protein